MIKMDEPRQKKEYEEYPQQATGVYAYGTEKSAGIALINEEMKKEMVRSIVKNLPIRVIGSYFITYSMMMVSLLLFVISTVFIVVNTLVFNFGFILSVVFIFVAGFSVWSYRILERDLKKYL